MSVDPVSISSGRVAGPSQAGGFYATGRRKEPGAILPRRTRTSCRRQNENDARRWRSRPGLAERAASCELRVLSAQRSQVVQRWGTGALPRWSVGNRTDICQFTDLVKREGDPEKTRDDLLASTCQTNG